MGLIPVAVLILDRVKTRPAADLSLGFSQLFNSRAEVCAQLRREQRLIRNECAFDVPPLLKGLEAFLRDANSLAASIVVAPRPFYMPSGFEPVKSFADGLCLHVHQFRQLRLPQWTLGCQHSQSGEPGMGDIQLGEALIPGLLNQARRCSKESACGPG